MPAAATRGVNGTQGMPVLCAACSTAWNADRGRAAAEADPTTRTLPEERCAAEAIKPGTRCRPPDMMSVQ